MAIDNAHYRVKLIQKDINLVPLLPTSKMLQELGWVSTGWNNSVWEGGGLGIILEDPSNYVKQRIGGEKKEGLVLLVWWKVFIRSWLKNEQLYRLEVCADENTKVKFEEEDKGVVVKELVVEIENFPNYIFKCIGRNSSISRL